ncbi:hypothetical protein [Nocardioides panzhihuensis]|uniref:Uncharacterized protein n=1 Tax=Nocardioides panzhihuensis TaxID=860243 RepID=A0A7Z0IVN1_9ACTN|nr:hypothetical protein [Nocardioides panzhihuensis]NYI81261.1 hypothetical protein [Nocardioides panzhihuensis]
MTAHQGDLENCSLTGELTWVDRAASGVFAGTASMALGAGLDPATASAVALFVTPVATEALNAILSHHTKTQFAKAGAVLSIAADRRQVDPDQLADLADNPSKEFLVATALRAGANSTMPAKVVALGKVLAEGLSNDDAKVDTATMLALAFGDLEVAHIRVLDYLAGEAGPHGPKRAVSVVDFLEANPGYGSSISAIVATLERHGIIRTDGEPLKNLAWRVTHMDHAQLPYRYGVTVFGHELLARLREAVDGPAAVQPLAAEDEQ